MNRRDRRILLVEDSEDDAEFAVRALRRAGASGPIDVARDGEEALDHLLRRGASRPALVLLDIKMPKLDGFEVLRRLRADAPARQVVVVMLSSSDVREDVERAYALGVNGYVCKPVQLSEYEAVLDRVVQYWIRVNEVVEGT